MSILDGLMNPGEPVPRSLDIVTTGFLQSSMLPGGISPRDITSPHDRYDLRDLRASL